jgi:hypothetical protein
MADKPIDNQAELNKLRKESNRLLEQEEQKLMQLNEVIKAMATADGKSLNTLQQRRKEFENQLKVTRKTLEENQKALDNEEAKLTTQKKQNDELEREKRIRQNIGKDWRKIGKDVQDQIKASNNGANLYTSLSGVLVKLKLEEANLDGEALESNQQKQQIVKGQLDAMKSQAAAVVSVEKGMKGINDRMQKREELAESIKDMDEEIQQQVLGTFDATTKLMAKEERLSAIKKGQEGIMGALPAGLQKAIAFTKQLITYTKAWGIEAGIATGGILLVAGAIVAGLEAFTALESAGEDFRKETGITNSEMGEISNKVNDINKNYAKFGVEAKDVYDTVAALKSEFADFADYSTAAVGALTVMKTNFGVSAETAAKVQGIMENIGGLSEDTAASVQLQVANMSKLAGVAPKKVMEDIAKSAEHASTLFKGDINLIAKQAVEARRLGSNLESVAKTAEKLLDFEGGIEDELKAATFVGGQFNLSTARGLAMQGKTVEANQEILNQLQRGGDFRKKDYFTQQALAKAAGKSVEDINKELNVRDKLGRLSEEERKKAEKAIQNGLDISKINDDQLEQEVAKNAAQQEMASSISEIENAFKGIIASVGGSLIPLFKMLGPIIKIAMFPFKVGAWAIQFIVDGITWLLKKIPFVAKAMEAVGKAFNWIDSFFSKTSVDSLAGEGKSTTEDTADVTPTQDLLVPESGAPMVMAKGKVYQGALGDEVAMSPGIASKGGGTQSGGTSDNIGGAFSGAVNSMVSELKALRADLAAGKIGISMDGTKVTKGISNAVDKSTRNNYSLS